MIYICCFSLKGLDVNLFSSSCQLPQLVITLKIFWSILDWGRDTWLRWRDRKFDLKNLISELVKCKDFKVKIFTAARRGDYYGIVHKHCIASEWIRLPKPCQTFYLKQNVKNCFKSQHLSSGWLDIWNYEEDDDGSL